MGQPVLPSCLTMLAMQPGAMHSPHAKPCDSALSWWPRRLCAAAETTCTGWGPKWQGQRCRVCGRRARLVAPGRQLSDLSESAFSGVE